MNGQPPGPTVDLARLHDILMAQPVSYAPQTIGWYILATLLLALAVWVAYRIVVHRRKTQYRRDALTELTAIEHRLQNDDRAAAFVDLDVLVKRVALVAYQRDGVAALTGEEWLTFLDRTAGGDAFRAGDGRSLGSLPFSTIEQRKSVPPEKAARLSSAVRHWIRSHHVPV